MPPKFGNYLFRNLKGQTGESDPTACFPTLEETAELSEQTLLLRSDDFVDSDGDLNWSILNPPEVRIPFRDTQGLMEGRVVISASVVRQSYPSLVSSTVKDDRLFLISLKAVVLQLQNCLRNEKSEARTAPSADFDTPIAQVAREDEGFLKLERAAQQDPPRSATSDPEVSFPLIREKPQSTAPNPPAVQVVPPPPSAVTAPPPAEARPDPFKDLPKIVARQEEPKPELRPSEPEVRAGRGEVRSDASVEVAELLSPSPNKPLRRLALERLQEIFLTDDYLDARQVAKLLRAFPKVKAALILLEDGTVMGGDLPEDFHLESALSAPGLLRAGREFMQALNGSTAVAITLLADVPVSIFLERKVCILIAHEGRGLLPGMRERISEIAKALAAMYEPFAN
jgi:hypothetical protein